MFIQLNLGKWLVSMFDCEFDGFGWSGGVWRERAERRFFSRKIVYSPYVKISFERVGL